MQTHIHSLPILVGALDVYKRQGMRRSGYDLPAAPTTEAQFDDWLFMILTAFWQKLPPPTEGTQEGPRTPLNLMEALGSLVSGKNIARFITSAERASAFGRFMARLHEEAADVGYEVLETDCTKQVEEEVEQVLKTLARRGRF
jgi:hypothetical protein